MVGARSCGGGVVVVVADQGGAGKMSSVVVRCAVRCGMSSLLHMLSKVYKRHRQGRSV